MRITNKMMNNNSVYNINNNKEYLDQLNTQMASQKKYNDPSDDPITAVRALRFRSNLSEIKQYLDKNVSDAVSWTDSTQTAIDTAKNIMRSLKAEYTSASNGTNETTDKWTYYQNMVNLVNEYFSVGNSTNESRYLFTGYRTADSLTFSDKNFDDRADAVSNGVYNYVGITEDFQLTDLESYTYTARKDKNGAYGSTGITDDEITNLDNINGIETNVQNVEAYRLRLSYEELDETQTAQTYSYKDTDGTTKTGTTKAMTLEIKTTNTATSPPTITYTTFDTVNRISNDTELNQADIDSGKIYLNTTTGNLIFGADVQEKLTKEFSKSTSTLTYEVSFQYNKSSWNKGDVKPEHYFDCVDIGLGTGAGAAIVYNDHEQSMNYNVGDSQQIKVNANASSVFTLDARRDLDELYDALTAADNAQSKVDRIKEMQQDTARYDDSKQQQLTDMLAAANKELEYANERVNTMMSNGMTRASAYFDMVNLAGTDMGTVVKRLELVKNRLTEDKTTIDSQASDNENIDISTLAVDVNAASLSYSAALQVTGKISQQSLVNYI